VAELELHDGKGFIAEVLFSDPVAVSRAAEALSEAGLDLVHEDEIAACGSLIYCRSA
jgi:hypothetical protein